MNEYIVTICLSPLAENQVFTAWPLHITMVPWFEVDDVNETIAAVERVGIITKPFQFEASDKVYFGRGRSTPVFLIKQPEPLLELHATLVRELGSVNAATYHERYMGKNFRPHITDRNGRLDPAKIITVDKLYFVEADKNANRLTRKRIVRAVVPLHLKAAAV